MQVGWRPCSCLLRRVDAAAHVAEAAAPLEEVVADLVELLDFLLDVTLVDAAALVTVAAPACEVVFADLVDLLHLTRLAWLARALAALAAAAARLALALGLLGLLDVLAGAGVAEAATAGVEVTADLHGEVAAAGCVEARVVFAVAEAAAVAELAVARLLEGEALRKGSNSGSGQTRSRHTQVDAVRFSTQGALR